MKELRKIFFVLGLITLTFFGVGSALAEDNALNKININGSASMDVMPDMAYVHFTVCGRGKTAGEATAENAAKVAEIRRALLGYGILGEEVQTLNYRLSPVYEEGKRKGYEADNDLQVKVNDLAKVGFIIDKISKSGVDEINDIDYDVSNPALYQKQLLTQAVGNARQQAAVVASAGGRSLGYLLYANIHSFNSWDRPRYNVLSKNATYADGVANTDIATHNITLKANVDVSFALQ